MTRRKTESIIVRRIPADLLLRVKGACHDLGESLRKFVVTAIKERLERL